MTNGKDAESKDSADDDTTASDNEIVSLENRVE
jgi:hypothetical protein